MVALNILPNSPSPSKEPVLCWMPFAGSTGSAGRAGGRSSSSGIGFEITGSFFLGA